MGRIQTMPATKRKGQSAGRSPWLIFCDEQRQGMQNANPGRTLPVVAALLAEQWKLVGSADSDKYQALALREGFQEGKKKKVAQKAPGLTQKQKDKQTQGEASRKEKIVKTKAKVKQLKIDIAASEKLIKAAEKGAAKLSSKKEELTIAEAKLQMISGK